MMLSLLVTQFPLSFLALAEVRPSALFARPAVCLFPVGGFDLFQMCGFPGGELRYVMDDCLPWKRRDGWILCFFSGETI